jgi:hypothetical protein
LTDKERKEEKEKRRGVEGKRDTNDCGKKKNG